MDAPSYNHPSNQAINALLVVALFACLATGTIWVWRTLVIAEQQQSEKLLQQETQILARQIETHFTYQSNALQRFAQRWEQYHQQRTLWYRDADRLLHDFDNLQAIEWLDTSHQLRWIRPLAGNEQAIDFRYPADHPNIPFVARSREQGRPILSSHFELVQGGRGLAYYVPLYRQTEAGRQFDGHLIAIFRVEQLIDSLLRRLPVEHMSLMISDGSQPIFQRKRADTLDSPNQVQTRVQLGDNNNFILHTYPSRELQQRHSTAVPMTTLVSGLLASLLLCYALWLALLDLHRLRALQDSNRALQSEIARRQQTEEVLQTSQSRLRLILDMTDYSHDALFILSLDPLEIVYMNRTCWTSIGYSGEQLREIIAISPEDVMPGAKEWLQALQQLVIHSDSAIYQRQVRTRTGRLIPLEISVRHMNRLGRDYLICVGRNNRQQLEATAQLERLTQLDGLTGLFNRRHFDTALVSEWRRLQRQQLPLGLLMVDVDYFKHYNDSLGHQAGDDALRQLGHALQLHVGREGERVCRYGGEEFALLLPGADLQQCRKVAELIHEAVREMNIQHAATPTNRMTVSIGVACTIPGADRQPEGLLGAADRALYQAKAAGRNCSASAELVS